jgi:hypothetical protein
MESDRGGRWAVEGTEGHRGSKESRGDRDCRGDIGPYRAGGHKCAVAGIKGRREGRGALDGGYKGT